MNKLGLLYANLADEIPFAPGPVLNLINDAGEEVSSEVPMITNPEKQRLQLELCQCFHQYLMKYLSMICSGHVPMWADRVNKDVNPFISYFLPKGVPVNKNDGHARGSLFASGFQEDGDRGRVRGFDWGN